MNNTLCLDLGASQLKGIYQLNGQENPCALSLLPNVLEIDSSHIASYQSQSLTLSDDLGWIKPTKKSETVMVVDQLAEQIFHCADYQELKINTGNWRIMAAIGKMLAIESVPIPEEGIKLDLTILLPFGEVKKDDLDTFAQKLKKQLKSFYYRENRLKIYLNNFKCLPEGIGSLSLINQSNQRVITVMLGHRNSSYLYFDHQGKFREGKSIQLGFHTLVRDFCQKASGQEENNLVTMTLWKTRLNLKELRKITKTTQKDLYQQEISNLEQAFITSRKELWSKLKKWLLKEVGTFSFDELLFTGGIAEFLKPLIEQDSQFKGLPITFAGEKGKKDVLEAIDFKNIPRGEVEDLSVRLIDCQGVFKHGQL